METWNREQLLAQLNRAAESYLDTYETIGEKKVFREVSPETIDHLRRMPFLPQGRGLEEVTDFLLQELYPQLALLQHPRFFAFIPSPASPVSWLGDVINTAFNPYGTSWIEGSGVELIEKDTLAWLCAQVGYPKGSGGVFVSGGSMANMTALTAARDTKLKEEEFGLGVAFLSEQTHNSSAKALHIMGLRREQIVRVGCDSRGRMLPKALKREIEAGLARGKKPFVVVATAGTTNTGAIDPLNEIADLCREFGLWMHVDGAYGATGLLSDRVKPLFAGIERSDSVAWDAHKWLQQTFCCSMTLVRNAQDLVNTFSIDPEYLQDAGVEGEEFNFWDYSPELSRCARGVKLWYTLQVQGTDAIAQAADRAVANAQALQQMLENRPGWRVVSPAQLGIVCFRYEPEGVPPEKLDGLNSAMAAQVTADGYAGVMTTVLRGQTVLRICCIHPDTTLRELETTIEKLEACAPVIPEGRAF